MKELQTKETEGRDGTNHISLRHFLSGERRGSQQVAQLFYYLIACYNLDLPQDTGQQQCQHPGHAGPVSDHRGCNFTPALSGGRPEAGCCG